MWLCAWTAVRSEVSHVRSPFQQPVCWACPGVSGSRGRFAVRVAEPTPHHRCSVPASAWICFQCSLQTEQRVRAGLGTLGDHLNFTSCEILRAPRKCLLIVGFKKIVWVLVHQLSGLVVRTIEGGLLKETSQTSKQNRITTGRFEAVFGLWSGG